MNSTAFLRRLNLSFFALSLNRGLLCLMVLSGIPAVRPNSAACHPEGPCAGCQSRRVPKSSSST